MTFTIVGAGALGTILGAHLIRAGHPVRMLARGRRAEEIARHGLRIEGLADLVEPCEVARRAEPARDDDVLVFAVKTYHMEEAVRGTRHLAPRAVFSLANGVMKNDQLAAAFGRDPLLGCMANFSGELRDDGRVAFTRNVKLFLGGREPLASELARTIDAAGIVAEASDRIETVEWSKFVGWVALFALAVVARAPTGSFLDEPHFAQIGVSIIKESAALAAARGIPLLDQSPLPVARIARLPSPEAVEALRDVGRQFTATAPAHRLSALQDLEAGRPLEVHETLGYAVREAARLGVEAPTLALSYCIGAGLDALRSRM